MSGLAKFVRARAQIFYKLKKKFSRAHGNLIEENKFLESSIIIVKNCMIIKEYYI
jgi:hypothetical protein